MEAGVQCMPRATPARRLAALLYCAGLIFLVAVGSPPDVRADNKALGQFLSSECVTCHQLSGDSTGGIPSITGWPRAQFIAVLRSYRTKERDNEVMQTIAGRLTDEEIAALAAYFEEQGKK